MSKTNCLTNLIAALLLLAACDDRNHSSDRSVPSDNQTTEGTHVNNLTDHWLGQWNGPEGTYLLLSKNGEKYVVKIQSLDGWATYEGNVAGDRIQFQRDGNAEMIRAGSGRDTEMKWLLDKRNCLIIKAGEGFCRD
jgi:hypothetical protein